MHIVIAMAKVGQVGKFSIHVFAPSQHDNKYIKVKGKGGENLGKFRLDTLKWECNIRLTYGDKKKILAWVEEHLEEINNKINALARV